MHVVCIKEGSWSGGVGNPHSPAKGDVLTVRRVKENCDGHFLLFVEIVNPDFGCDAEAVFWAPRFRPLDERRLDIFRAVLTKAPTPEKEPA